MPPIDYSLNNRLLGNAAANIIEALGGNDIVYGRGGDDEIYGGRGNDRIYGQEGNDLLDGGRGEDAMDGGNGDDCYYVDNEDDRTIEARSTGGTDKVYVSVNWTLGDHIENLRLYRSADIGKGNALDNEIEGSGTDNRLYGRGGDDTLIGNKGDDYLFGQDGDDVLWGGGRETIFKSVWDGYSGPGNDGADVIDGGSGSDTFALQDAFSIYEEGFDVYQTSLALDAIVDLKKGTVRYENDGHSADRLISIETVSAASGDDRIYGSEASNTLRGGDGANTLSGRGGNDMIVGGQGSGSGETEKLYGGTGDDTLISGDAFMFYESPGPSEYFSADYLSGGAGDDRLVAGFGDMQMRGGEGADSFEFDNGVISLVESGYDYGDTGKQASILDFSRTEGDKIALDIRDHPYAFDGTPLWIGEGEIEGEGEIGWQHVTDENGNTDTVITLGLFYPSEQRVPGDLAITLEDWAYTLRESDFLFV